MIELIIPPLRLTGLLPEFVGAVDDLIFGWLYLDAFLMKAAPPWGFGEDEAEPRRPWHLSQPCKPIRVFETCS